jgi:hypothetical protein
MYIYILHTHTHTHTHTQALVTNRNIALLASIVKLEEEDN